MEAGFHLSQQRLSAAETNTERGRIDNDDQNPRKNKSPVTESSGNVFADLGLIHPDQALLKARLTLQVYRTTKERKLTQTQAGDILGTKQPQVSSLMRGQSGAFSVERLMAFITALGHDIEIAIAPSRNKHGEMSVIFGR